MNRNYYIWLIVVIMVCAVFLILFSRNQGPKVNLDLFAKCLTEKNVTMYGAVWCSHCKTEKARFGSSFKYVNYVECPENAKVCEDKGIQGFPTWEIGDKLYEGEQGLQKLSELSGCELPQGI